MRHSFTMDPSRIGRGLAALFALGAATMVAIALTGCVTVPDGLPQALAAQNTLNDSNARDEASARAELDAYFGKLSAGERTRLFGEQYDWTLQEAAKTSDTLKLRDRFITRAGETEASIAAFDKPFATWHARSVQREKNSRDAITMSNETLAALRYAATATLPVPTPAPTPIGGQ